MYMYMPLHSEQGTTNLVFLKQRSTDIAVEGVCKVSLQHPKPCFQVIRLLSIVNRVHKEIHKPDTLRQQIECARHKILTHHVREYWYIGSMLARSLMEKNNTEEWTAIGL